MDNNVGELSGDFRAGVEPAHKSYMELFTETFPYYLSIGMTYEQYWEEDAEMVVFYRKAEELKRKKRNEELWMQGLYIYEALCDASPLFRDLVKGRVMPHPYCTAPKPITRLEQKEAREREAKENQDKIRQRMWDMISHFKRSEEDGND